MEGSTYHQGHLKRRLFLEGVKKRECEICGQGEIWRGSGWHSSSTTSMAIRGTTDSRTAHRLPELRRDAPHSLRAQERRPPRRADLRPMWRAFSAQVPATPLLLSRVRDAMGSDGFIATRSARHAAAGAEWFLGAA